MTAGRPVVASDVNGTRDQIIDGLTGSLVPPGDIPALRGALAALVKDPERAAAMGRAGRERVEQEFSAPIVVPRLVDLLNRAIARGRRR
jgi:type III pantothenate kinase